MATEKHRLGAPTDEVDALIIGAGPAGLMAAETLAGALQAAAGHRLQGQTKAAEIGPAPGGMAGYRVLIAESRPSPARKFLMAGKSGLNLTKDQPNDDFLNNFQPLQPLAPLLAGFGPAEVMAWARGLGQEVFTGSTGRVFPVAMKASPLLRAWLARLAALGAQLQTRWHWTGWDGGEALFATPDGPRRIRAGVTVLALGGASWARLGSDGAWAPVLAAAGQRVAPFLPANAGLRLEWSDHMRPWLGQPVKNTGLVVGTARHRGEFVLSGRGIEGGGIYPLTPLLRQAAPLALDLAPDLTPAALALRLADRPGGRGKPSLSNRLRRAGLSPVQVALAQEFGRPLPAGPEALAARLKALPVPYAGLRPLDEAISTAGGLCWDGLSPDLELLGRPGVFAAGEMLDWEAPTGGYLLTGCLASGRHAGLAAARRLLAAEGAASA